MIDREKLFEQIITLQKTLDQQSNALDYEKTFDSKWKDITKEVFQSALGEPSKDRNKKKRL